MPRKRPPAKRPTQDLLAIALEARCDPRTVRRVLDGERSSSLAREAVARAARKLRLAVTVPEART